MAPTRVRLVLRDTSFCSVAQSHNSSSQPASTSAWVRVCLCAERIGSHCSAFLRELDLVWFFVFGLRTLTMTKFSSLWSLAAQSSSDTFAFSQEHEWLRYLHCKLNAGITTKPHTCSLSVSKGPTPVIVKSSSNTSLTPRWKILPF